MSRRGRKMINKGLFTSNTNEWSTPQSLFDALDHEFNFDLDPCANEQNHKCDRYFTRADDGLKQNWGGIACSATLRMVGESKTGFGKLMRNHGSQTQRSSCLFPRGPIQHGSTIISTGRQRSGLSADELNSATAIGTHRFRR